MNDELEKLRKELQDYFIITQLVFTTIYILVLGILSFFIIKDIKENSIKVESKIEKQPTTVVKDKIESMYDSLLKYEVYEPEISLAIIRLETGNLEYKNCCLQKNNFFAFLWKGKYKEFRDYKHSILYYKKWQKKHWLPYKKKYPKNTYYDFLKWKNYAPAMDYYNSQLKLLVDECEK